MLDYMYKDKTVLKRKERSYKSDSKKTSSQLESHKEIIPKTVSLIRLIKLV